ncbi:hypothetical protein [Xanthomonas sacchari]|uniref:hypothetical protein n=1 Tax=Xanthomonas sacchari TaxID=56458 RepID=UPI0022572BAC|nr:hypothetical protein [Xanthomonas sacchari]
MNTTFLAVYFLSLAICLTWFLMARRKGRTAIPSVILAVDMVFGVVLVRLAARSVPGLCSSERCALRVVEIFDFSSYMMIAFVVIAVALIFSNLMKRN